MVTLGEFLSLIWLKIFWILQKKKKNDIDLVIKSAVNKKFGDMSKQ